MHVVIISSCAVGHLAKPSTYPSEGQRLQSGRSRLQMRQNNDRLVVDFTLAFECMASHSAEDPEVVAFWSLAILRSTDLFCQEGIWVCLVSVS